VQPSKGPLWSIALCPVRPGVLLLFFVNEHTYTYYKATVIKTTLQWHEAGHSDHATETSYIFGCLIFDAKVPKSRDLQK
jgi:hypothetical protein